MLFPTPVGKSYSCQSETSVELQDGDVSATVFLRGFKLQPFISKKEFGPGKSIIPIIHKGLQRWCTALRIAQLLDYVHRLAFVDKRNVLETGTVSDL
jgi:hypothetical protein